MNNKLLAVMTCAALCLSSISAVLSPSASAVVLDSASEENAISLTDYTTDYYALNEADSITFSGNQVLLKIDLMVQVSGCVVSPDEMEWEVGGTADVTFESDVFSKSLSYEENYANSYCLITAESPGTVCVKGTEINTADGTRYATFYWNMTVGEDGNFDGTVTFNEPEEDMIADPADTCTLEIDQLPDKLNYKIGEELDLTGAVVSVDYQSVFTGNVTYDEVVLTEHLDIFSVDTSDFDNTAVGTYTIRITYTGAHTYDTAVFEVTVDDPSPYPASFAEYTELLDAYPELYRVDEDSVYFINPKISSTQLSLIISGNQESSVDRNTYGCIFKPEEDGRYVVTVQEYTEELISVNDNHFHYFYPVLKNYVVDVTDGMINVELKGSKSWYSEEQIAIETESIGVCDVIGLCYDVAADNSEDVLDWWYFSYVNGQIPDNENGLKSYITTIYGKYTTESYFCTTLIPLTIEVEVPRVILSDENVGKVCPVMGTCSSVTGDLEEGTCDVLALYRVQALSDGDITITVDEIPYNLTVENGIFHHAVVSELPGDVNNDTSFSAADVVMLQRWLVGAGNMTCPQNADLCADGRIDAFDLCVMKQKLLKGTSDAMLLIMDDQILCDSVNGWYSKTYIEVIDTNGFVHIQESDMSSWEFDVEYYLEEADNIISDIEPSSSMKFLDIIAVEEFSQTAAGYNDCQMTPWNFGIDDYGQENLYAVYKDETGTYQALELCRFGGECAWLDNTEVQEFVTMLIQNGYYADSYMFEFFLENQ